MTPPLTERIRDDRTKSDITQPRIYGYTQINFPQPVVWTLGLSYSEYNDDPIDEEALSPKVGVTWNIRDDLLFRAAYFQVVKPALANNTTT